MKLAVFKPKYQAMELKRVIVPSCKSVLDVGCGKSSNLRHLSAFLTRTVGVDLFKSDLKAAKATGIHSEYINSDINKIDRLFRSKSFDCVMAMDVVEHLEKKRAVALIIKMEKLAKKFVIIGTPNGFVSQGPLDGNVYQIHKCGFTPSELTILGFTVMGMDGPKFLRTYAAQIRFKPRIIFSVISNLIDPLLRRYPNSSFSLFAYKNTSSHGKK